MMIDVIIPAYNSNNTIEMTLMSLAFQTIKEQIKVIIVDDNSNNKYDDIIDKYSKLIAIKYIRNETNIGAGLSRQVGIDSSNSKYIIFLDADDILNTFDSLEIMLKNIEGYEYLDSYLYNELDNKKYINAGDLHGKMYLRDFILSNNIRFNDSRYHEDNAFNSIVLLYNPKKNRINELTYIYSDNKESLTRKDSENEFDRLQIYINNMRYVLDCTKNCSNNLREQYLMIKYNYLINYCSTLDDEKKQLINEWLEKNELDILF